MRLCVIQMNSSAERDENVARAMAHIDTAVAEHNPDLVVLPEFFNTVYFAQWWDTSLTSWAEPDDGPTLTAVRERARRYGIHVVATILEYEGPGVIYDTAIVVGPDGGTVGKYRKVHPAAVQSLEVLYYRAGSSFPVVRIGPWRVGMIICYDTMFPESARCAALNGAELVVVPFAAPQQLLWRDIMRTRALENGVYFAPANKVGTEGEWTFGGQSMVVDPLGVVLAEAGDTNDEILFAELSRTAVEDARRRYPMLRDRRPATYTPIASPTENLPL